MCSTCRDRCGNYFQLRGSTGQLTFANTKAQKRQEELNKLQKRVEELEALTLSLEVDTGCRAESCEAEVAGHQDPAQESTCESMNETD